ncbi:hypothetical protein DYB25_008113 [Aphanomyces astaci]|uniref:Uncharacterized protein n=1 Tax=Aphanomyces astaci TaxID=112090 RepID=A0A397CJP4_APHAT|nr:hypothetical protein DYB25_008113 [Aphanomyces astaci]RHY44763.1 hypothetical protein DYB30_012721 [Aphanomyces astaci]RHY47515.1 hypothetical protein DYB34_011484 [Aphanomyces astaci]
MSTTIKTVGYNHEDRQWDARVNVQDDEYLQNVLESIMLENAKGKFKYILVGGVEIGTLPNQTDYQVKHADEAFQVYPRNYMIYGEKIKAMIHQKKKAFFGKHTDPHLYLYGYPGTGKTSLFQFIYGDFYKKNLENRFWDLYDEEILTTLIS